MIRELGGEVDECELPHAAHGLSAYYVLAPAEASANLARYDGVRFGPRADADGDLIAMYERTRAEGFGAEVKRRIMLGTYALSSGYYEAYYGRAQRVRTKIADDFRAAFERFDYLVTPTSPTVAFRLGERTANPLAMYMSDFCTVPMSLAGIPAISIPAGLAEPDGGGPELPGRLPDRRPRPSASRACSMPLTRWSERSASTPGRRGWASRVSVPEGYEAVIGLEIHVQLSTRTKMFCGCELSFGEEPNTHTCPVCLGHPGTLPVINEQAVRYALQIALALGCETGRALDLPPQELLLSRPAEGLPDQPVRHPAGEPGAGSGDVRIHRVHLEEDAAKLIHVGESGRIHGSATSLVDFNRGGTPLVEIVTEPDLRGPAEAREWAQLLRTTVKQLGVSDVNMEEGSLRCDANVSVRRAGAEELGTKTELKNMNSFRFLERGIAAELERQGAARGGGAGGAGDLSLRPQNGGADSPALEGVRARLPLLPRARPGPAGAHRGDAARSERGASRAARPRARALRGRARAAGGDRPPARLRRRAGRLFRTRS